MKRIAVVLCLVVCSLFIATACDKDHGSSGGTLPQDAGAKTVPVARLTGPDSTNTAYTTFECISKESGTRIIARQWRVTGNGAIEGASNQKTLRVKATSSGSLTVKLRVLSDQKVWSRWADKTVAVNLPGFVVTLTTVVIGSPMTGSPATGSAATFTMPMSTCGYSHYSIAFDGDTSGLPAQVPVTISWSADFAIIFRWAASDAESGSQTVNVPLGGGSIGQLGTVLDTGSLRPNLACTPFGFTAGTVTFSAPGVNTLTITVVRQ